MSDAPFDPTRFARIEALSGNLTPRAMRMLQRSTWTEPPFNQETFLALLKQANVPATDPLLQFQKLYGGLKFDVRGDGINGHMSLIMNNRIHKVRSNDQTFLLLAAGDVDFGFALDLEAAIYVEVEGQFAPMHSTPEKFIESAAVLDELLDLAPRWTFVPFGGAAQSDHQLDEAVVRVFGLKLIPEASDAYDQWWESPEMRFHRTTFYSVEPGSCFFLYARSFKTAKTVIDALVALNLRKAQECECHTYPIRV
jgi:hypothetical protein